jgi:hypothetical protein
MKVKRNAMIGTILLAIAGATPAAAQSSPPAAPQQPAPPPGPPFGRPITVEQAQKAAEAAMAKAKEIGVPNAIAVVEPTGDLVYFAKMDGALLCNSARATKSRCGRAISASDQGLL